MSNKALDLHRVSHAYGNTPVLDGITLRVDATEFVAVVGASGCGKSTLLNILSGHIKPTEGTVSRHGRLRMVHQRDGLFPWMTTRENVGLALRHSCDPLARKRQLDSVLEIVRLTKFADQYPHRLSAGMRQRVELARAIAGDAEILLLDEPLSSLDFFSRQRLGRELVGWLADRRRAVVLVTHDLVEAAQLSDRVIVLGGRPATILNDLKLQGCAPRDPTDPTVIAAVHQLRAELYCDLEIA